MKFLTVEITETPHIFSWEFLPESQSQRLWFSISTWLLRLRAESGTVHTASGEVEG